MNGISATSKSGPAIVELLDLCEKVSSAGVLASGGSCGAKLSSKGFEA
jgi:hypothetical protein